MREETTKLTKEEEKQAMKDFEELHAIYEEQKIDIPVFPNMEEELNAIDEKFAEELYAKKDMTYEQHQNTLHKYAHEVLLLVLKKG